MFFSLSLNLINFNKILCFSAEVKEPTSNQKCCVKDAERGLEIFKIFFIDPLAFAEKNIFKILPVPLHSFFVFDILDRPTRKVGYVYGVEQTRPALSYDDLM